MKFFSTRNKNYLVSFQEALRKGLSPDGGLFLPERIPQIAQKFPHSCSIQEIGLAIAQAFIEEEIPEHALEGMVARTLSFPFPIIPLEENISILELFHGPTRAFKDVGARFFAEALGYFSRGNSKEITILVATSGDTGGAVAQGFYGVAGTRVLLLYPRGKVSAFQEQQMTTLGGNITALEIDGSFDDCQAMVKQAFLDADLNEKLDLSSANSINIARLLPQSFYHAFASKQLEQKNRHLVLVVPSGNFGNLCAGLLAQSMGFPIHAFLAATNANDIVPKYLETGIFSPRASQATISNAMDVGNPSNFERLLELCDGSLTESRARIRAYAVSDEQTRARIRSCFQKHGYLLDPHGAVGLEGIYALREGYPPSPHFCLLETADPGKFAELVWDSVQGLPEEKLAAHKLRSCLLPENARKKVSIPLAADFSQLKDLLLSVNFSSLAE